MKLQQSLKSVIPTVIDIFEFLFYMYFVYKIMNQVILAGLNWNSGREYIFGELFYFSMNFWAKNSRTF